MSNLNQVILQGNLVEDPKLFNQDDEDKGVARFTVAVNNGYGEYASTTFVDCVAFGKQSATIGRFLEKGKQVLVRGQLSTSRWEDKETGKNRSKLEVILERVNGFFFTGNAAGASEENANAGQEVAAGAEGFGDEGLL